MSPEDAWVDVTPITQETLHDNFPSLVQSNPHCSTIFNRLIFSPTLLPLPDSSSAKPNTTQYNQKSRNSFWRRGFGFSTGGSLLASWGWEQITTHNTGRDFYNCWHKISSFDHLYRGGDIIHQNDILHSLGDGSWKVWRYKGTVNYTVYAHYKSTNTSTSTTIKQDTIATPVYYNSANSQHHSMLKPDRQAVS